MSAAVSVANRVFRSRRLMGVSLRELRDFVVAQAYLLLALWVVRRRPKGALLRMVNRPRVPVAPRDSARLARIAVAVDRAARRGLFRPTCLVRAVALERMVTRIEADAAVVRVGVARDGDKLLAHAWLELDGRVLGDDPAFVRRFAPLEDFSALS